MENSNQRLKDSNEQLFSILETSTDIEEARKEVFNYLVKQEQKLDADTEIYELERMNAKKCISVFKNILAPVNEKKAGFSTLSLLLDAAKGKIEAKDCFITEFIHLFKGIAGRSGLYSAERPAFAKMTGREAAIARSDFLDKRFKKLEEGLKRYVSGLDKDVAERRERNKQKILKYFNAAEEDWQSWRWQTEHVIKTAKVMSDLIHLEGDYKRAIELAEEHKIPFGVTPYYLSFMDEKEGMDDAVRAQVIPPLANMEFMVKNKNNRGSSCDFMKEGDTSPIDLVTRRYPSVAILKPFNTCPQICVYCQRNWEIDEVLAKNALASREDINNAINWFREHPAIKEILITGGDPGILEDDALEYILDKVSKIDHIEKIRIATRVIATMPCRVTDTWADLLAKYHIPGKREIYVVTHVEHPYEITPEMKEAVQKLTKKGFCVYNQQVMTPYNTKRFESVALRRALKSIGIDPYYSFFSKGKKEVRDYLIPVARILQERKEEARLLPGSSRTDEPVFNVPGLGKNHLRALQDHELIAIDKEGARVWEFHPWEKNLTTVDTYLYADVPITEYLKKLGSRGDKAENYETIWWYY